MGRKVNENTIGTACLWNFEYDDPVALPVWEPRLEFDATAENI